MGYLLQGRYFSQRAYHDDTGSGAHDNLVVVGSNMGIQDGGFYPIMALASGGSTSLPPVLCVRPHPDSFEGNPLADPSGWNILWSMTKTWDLVTATSSRSDYVSLSDCFCYRVDAEANGPKLVSRDCVKPASIGGCIWTDHGSGADLDGSVWAINGGAASDPAWTTFVAQQGYDPPGREVFVLNMDVVEMV